MSINLIQDLPKYIKAARDFALLGGYQKSLETYKKIFQILEKRMNEISNDSYLLEKWKDTKEKIKNEAHLVIQYYDNIKIFQLDEKEEKKDIELKKEEKKEEEEKEKEEEEKGKNIKNKEDQKEGHEKEGNKQEKEEKQEKVKERHEKDNNNEDINELKKQNLNLRIEIEQLKDKLNEEKIKNLKLTFKLEELANILNKDKKSLLSIEKEMTKKLDELNKNYNKKFEKLQSIFPFQISEDDKIISTIFMTSDENIRYSMICKSTEKFIELEERLYNKYPEYKEKKNYYCVNGQKINVNETLEYNKVKDNEIIIIYNDNDNNIL